MSIMSMTVDSVDFLESWQVYLSLHVHDDNGIGAIANHNIIRIFRQQMHRIDIDTSSRRSADGFESVQALGRLGVPHLNGAIGACRDQLVAV